MGRIFDLSIIVYSFDSYEELVQHADCKYAVDVNQCLTSFTRRVESLNMVGDLLWPAPIPPNFKEFPVSRYEWLVLSADVFLMRYVSILDCAILLINEVFELGLAPKKCSMDAVRKKGVPSVVVDVLVKMQVDQGHLRTERNMRFHHGNERGFTDDDVTFRMAALFEHRSGGVTGEDRFGRKLNVERFFKEGLIELQRDFNGATRRLSRLLDKLYDFLGVEFEARFGPRIRRSTHGFRTSRGA